MFPELLVFRVKLELGAVFQVSNSAWTCSAMFCCQAVPGAPALLQLSAVAGGHDYCLKGADQWQMLTVESCGGVTKQQNIRAATAALTHCKSLWEDHWTIGEDKSSIQLRRKAWTGFMARSICIRRSKSKLQPQLQRPRNTAASERYLNHHMFPGAARQLDMAISLVHVLIAQDSRMPCFIIRLQLAADWSRFPHCLYNDHCSEASSVRDSFTCSSVTDYTLDPGSRAIFGRRFLLPQRIVADSYCKYHVWICLILSAGWFLCKESAIGKDSTRCSIVSSAVTECDRMGQKRLDKQSPDPDVWRDHGDAFPGGLA